MESTIQKEHQWLQKLAGEWTFESTANMKPGDPPMKSEGIESVRSIGGFWIMGEGKGEMPGCGPVTMILTLGFDPRTKRFTGTWIGSMMDHLWVYDGELDASGKILSLVSKGPGMTDPTKLETFKDVVELVSDDERTLSSYHQGEDGKWTQFMTSTYRRKK